MMFKLLILDQETPPKPRIAKPWENPGLREKNKSSGSSSIGVPFLNLIQLFQMSLIGSFF